MFSFILKAVFLSRYRKNKRNMAVCSAFNVRP